MSRNELPLAVTRLITPRALKGYVEGLGWQRVEGVEGPIAAYSSPADKNRQIIVPLDDGIDDYADRTADAVGRLADFENRPAREVLDHLLLPPADILSFHVVAPETEAGEISLELGEQIIDGARGALLAVAHSAIAPQPYHPRMGRDEARKFLGRCRMTTGRGSFVLSVACLLDQPPSFPDINPEPFTRRVTSLFVGTLKALEAGPGQVSAEWLTDVGRAPGISANFCEALLHLRPIGDRSFVTVAAEWSRARPRPVERGDRIRLDQEVFQLAEELAPRLRSRPEHANGTFVGYVEELRGAPTANDSRPSGEVRMMLLFKDEEVRVRLELSPNDYATAARAHLASAPVKLRGELHRQPRQNRVDQMSHLEIIDIEGGNRT
jgi:hypothetical protein